MAIREVTIGSKGPYLYDDNLFDAIRTGGVISGTLESSVGTSNDRIVKSNTNKKIVEVSTLASWINGNDGLSVTDDGAGGADASVDNSVARRDEYFSSHGTGPQDIGGTVKYAELFTNIVVTDGTHYNVANRTALEIVTAGNYRIAVSVDFERPSDAGSTTGRSVMSIQPEINSNALTGRVATCQIENDTDGRRATATLECVAAIGSLETLKIIVTEVVGGETGNDINTASIVVEYLN